MQQSWLFLLAVAVSPLATGAYTVDCIDGGGTYKANSTYEANLRRLAAIVPAEISSSNILFAFRGVGSWPNRPRAASHCYMIINSNGTVSSPSASSCAACIAGAFREAERACPYGKKAVVFGHSCRLSLAGFPSAVVFGMA
ncbi:hypothetical protein BRADI_1g25670v3 [Brachypodium distachyon]|uniref:Gnk2-homologous domain-containing protein n=1 Tax=Brachypodium distachyon TaxID=15368 RepID=A0A0Q3JD55_BRADI|nr:hypothetical protein BRADI_1g25670v3 [Brachypodium distachyon]